MSSTKRAVTLIGCMDGNIADVVDQNLEHLYPDHIVDRICLAGIIKMIVDDPDNEQIMKSIEISLAAHGSRDIELVIHGKCGYYAIANPIIEKKVQINDARTVMGILKKKFKKLFKDLKFHIRWVNREEDISKNTIEKIL